MIPCAACGHINPFGTRFCRSCGARIKPGQAQVAQAVIDNQKRLDSDQAWSNGLGWLTIGAFFLLCAVLAYVLIVPAPPPAEVPVPAPGPAPVVPPAPPPSVPKPL
jgi:hypothetical protein